MVKLMGSGFYTFRNSITTVFNRSKIPREVYPSVYTVPGVWTTARHTPIRCCGVYSGFWQKYAFFLTSLIKTTNITRHKIYHVICFKNTENLMMTILICTYNSNAMVGRVRDYLKLYDPCFLIWTIG